MNQEQINSYLIKRVKALEEDLEALSSVLHTLIDSLPDPGQEDLSEARRIQAIAASRAVLDEKTRLGKLLWSGSR